MGTAIYFGCGSLLGSLREAYYGHMVLDASTDIQIIGNSPGAQLRLWGYLVYLISIVQCIYTTEM